jgi:hypothetical protein
VPAGGTIETLAAETVAAAAIGDGETTTVPLQAVSATVTNATSTKRPADLMTASPIGEAMQGPAPLAAAGFLR